MEPLNGHEAGNGGHSQGDTCTLPRRSPTRLHTAFQLDPVLDCMHRLLGNARASRARRRTPRKWALTPGTLVLDRAADDNWCQPFTTFTARASGRTGWAWQ